MFAKGVAGSTFESMHGCVRVRCGEEQAPNPNASGHSQPRGRRRERKGRVRGWGWARPSSGARALIGAATGAGQGGAANAGVGGGGDARAVVINPPRRVPGQGLPRRVAGEGGGEAGRGKTSARPNGSCGGTCGGSDGWDRRHRAAAARRGDEMLQELFGGVCGLGDRGSCISCAADAGASSVVLERCLLAARCDAMHGVACCEPG